MFKIKTYRGFTLVELLIVIVVIAILAAISVVAYSGIQNRAHDSIVKGDLAAYAKKAELFNVDNGHYPTNSMTDMTALNYAAATESYYMDNYNLYYCTNSGVNDVFIFAARSKSGKSYYASSSGSGELSTTEMNMNNACTPTGLSSSERSAQYGYDLSSRSWRAWAKGV